jgi:hypothetical protein
MNITELLKLIEQIETGKLIKIVTETVEKIPESTSTLSQFSGNIKLIGTILIITFSMITFFGRLSTQDMDMSVIIQHFVGTFLCITLFTIGISGLENTNSKPADTEKTTVNKEIVENAIKDDIEKWKIQVIKDIKNHRKEKNAKIPIKTVAVAKEYLTYLKNNENKINEM